MLNVDKLPSQHSSLLIELFQNRREFEFNYSDENSAGKYLHIENGSVTIVADSWEQFLTLDFEMEKIDVVHIVAETDSVFHFKYSFLSRHSGHMLKFSSTKNINTINGFISLSKTMQKCKWNIISLQSSFDYSNPASCIEIGEDVKQLVDDLLFVGRIDIHFPNKPRSPLPLSVHARLICGIDSANAYRVDLQSSTVRCFIKKFAGEREILQPVVSPDNGTGTE